MVEFIFNLVLLLVVFGVVFVGWMFVGLFLKDE
jgi:hypothetical protein